MDSPKKQGFLKKTVVLLVSLSLMFSFSFSSLPKKAGAQVLTVPVADWLNFTSNTETAISTGWKVFEDEVLNNLATAIAKMALRKMTGSIIQWINTGFQGQPSFLVNPRAFFENIAKEQTNIFVIGLVAQQTNNPYAVDLAYSILNPSGKNFTLYDDMARNCQMRGGGNTCPPNLSSPQAREAYARQFIYGNVWGPGGWSNWYSLTQYNKNNIYGAYLEAQNELSRRKAEAVGRNQQDLLQSGGFLSFKKCVQWVDDGMGGRLCNKEVTQTPGKAAAEYLTTSLTSPIRQGELAKTFWDSVEAIAEALVNQVLVMGLRSLSDVVAGAVSGQPGGQTFVGTYINQPPTYPPGTANPQTAALADIAKSKRDEIDYISAKERVLDLVVAAENNFTTLRTCSEDPPVYSAGLNFIISTTADKITPLKESLNDEIGASEDLILAIEEIERELGSAISSIATLEIIQEFSALKSSGIFHTAGDVGEVNMVEFSAVKNDMDEIKDETAIKLTACEKTKACQRDPLSAACLEN